MKDIQKYRETSNFNRYKLKIENIDREIDRWQDVSHKKIESEHLHQYKRAQSGVINNCIENQIN